MSGESLLIIDYIKIKKYCTKSKIKRKEKENN
jgi:hypothetical protein